MSVTCDFCGNGIDLHKLGFTKNAGGIGVGRRHHLCTLCANTTRKALCFRCRGTGKVSVVDEVASNAQASCGENRTQYVTVDCNVCNS